MTKNIVKFNVKRVDCEGNQNFELNFTSINRSFIIIITDSDKVYSLEVANDISYEDFKKKVRDMLNITGADDRILKVRNKDGILIPLMDVLELNENET